MTPTVDHERELWQAGHRLVAGLDEVGRGCLAGPVVAGAVVLPASDPALCTVLRAAGLRDSKQMSALQRRRVAPLIEEIALGAAVGEASPAEIDELGIVRAVRLAMMRALSALPCEPQALLLDAFPLPDDARPQRAIVGGDNLCLSIAAASVVAKLYRDTLMERYDAHFPGYGFASNKGYAAPVHRAALQELGPTPLHRMSWAPLRNLHIHQPPLEGWDGEA